MIAVVDVQVNAANPAMPLFPMRAFQNSPSSIRVRNVPKKVGKWNISKVYFTAAYPDNSIKSVDCLLVGGVWVGTIDGSTSSGTSMNGYTIFADGTDENGNAVTGYVLGKGDIEILDADGTITPGENASYVHMLSSEPSNPKDGDLYQLSGTWYIWQDNQAWPIGDDSGVITQISAQLSSYAPKTIEFIEPPQTVQLPYRFYDNYGPDIVFLSTSGTSVIWERTEPQTKIQYDVSTGKLTLDNEDGTLDFGTYTLDEMIEHTYELTPFRYNDEYTTYYITPDDLRNITVDSTTTQEVVYAEGGYAGISSLIATKQDALSGAQLSAVDSGITSAKVAAYDALLSTDVELAQDITYSELSTLARQSKLNPGMSYRITDYKTTTTQTDTSANGVVLPIVVRAATTDALSPYGYMPSKKCEIKYDINNDTGKYAWADATNGKGVIYWMHDSYGNECPYDFKSILFKPYDPRTNPRTNMHYTFCYIQTITHAVMDASENNYAVNNIIMPLYTQSITSYSAGKLQCLNNIVIYAASSGGCTANYFGMNCRDIAIGVQKSGYPAGNAQGNWFGPTCNRIISNGQFANNFLEGVNNNLSFGYGTSNNHFEKACSNIIFGNSVDDLKSYWYYNYFAGPILRLKLTTSQTTSNTNSIRANKFGKFLAYSTTDFQTLNIDIVGQSYEVEYKRTGSQTITFN